MKTLLLVGMFAASAAFAQNVVVIQADPYAQAFANQVQQNRQQAYQLGQRLGNLLVPQVTGIVLGMKCGHFSQAVIMYSNGTEKDIASIPDDQQTQNKIKMLLSATPNASTVDLGCQG